LKHDAGLRFFAGRTERKTLTTFTELGLAEPLLRALESEGYTIPTPIQEQLIPLMRAGRDIVGIAQTGTGKTAAYILPILDHFALNKVRNTSKTARALILVPTRELAGQVAESIRAYGKHHQPSFAVITGGAKPGPQIRSMARGVDIVVATPGRLEDLMRSGDVRLDSTSVVVLDEADQMLDLGFIPAIRRLLRALPHTRQTAMLSATMPPAIRALASDFLNKPAEVAVAPQSRPIETVQQSVRFVPASAKRDVLLSLLAAREVERAIVFTRTKHGADRVCRHLETYGIKAAALHGNKSQSQRNRALAALKDGSLHTLVATDVAARGIDIDDVSHVINYEMPNIPESYVHRIGRTGRAGRSGIAISLVDGSEKAFLRDIERLTQIKIPVVDDQLGPMPAKSANPPPELPEREERQPRQQQNRFAHNDPRGERAGVANPNWRDRRRGNRGTQSRSNNGGGGGQRRAG
jgi:ATP-dependent RNA helicase RhlE